MAIWEHLDGTRETAEYASGECSGFPHRDYQSEPESAFRRGNVPNLYRRRLSEVPGYHADGTEVKPAPATTKDITPDPLARPGQRFVARHPILDKSLTVFGYELLFRNGIEDFFNADPESAARSTLDTSLLLF